MTITQLPATAAASVQKNLGLKGKNFQWTQAVAAGSLITGAVLLATGKRKAGLALTAVGATTALLEDAEGARHVWDNVPNYIQTGQQVLSRIERFVEEIAEQGERVRKMVNQQVR